MLEIYAAVAAMSPALLTAVPKVIAYADDMISTISRMTTDIAVTLSSLQNAPAQRAQAARRPPRRNGCCQGQDCSRAAQRYAREKAEFGEKMNQREAKEKETGKKPRGKAPIAPQPSAKDSDQINLTPMRPKYLIKMSLKA